MKLILIAKWLCFHWYTWQMSKPCPSLATHFSLVVVSTMYSILSPFVAKGGFHSMCHSIHHSMEWLSNVKICIRAASFQCGDKNKNDLKECVVLCFWKGALWGEESNFMLFVIHDNDWKRCLQKGFHVWWNKQPLQEH